MRREWKTESARWIDRRTFAESLQARVRCVIRVIEQIAPIAAPLLVGKRMAEIQGALKNVVYEQLAIASNDAGPRSSGEPATPNWEEGIPDTLTRVEAERLRTVDATRLRQLGLDRGAGVVVNIDAAAPAYGKALGALRTKLLAMPAELPPRLHARTEAQARAILAAAVGEALDDLQNAIAEIIYSPGSGAIH
jgi:hypothetical protein